jgi:hypothetical protein
MGGNPTATDEGRTQTINERQRNLSTVTLGLLGIPQFSTYHIDPRSTQIRRDGWIGLNDKVCDRAKFL